MKNLSPSFIVLPWNVNAAENWFASISDFPWSMMLHSGYTNHSCSRFDIVVSDPIGTLVTYNDVTTISMQKKTTSLKDPFFLIKKTLNQFGFYTKPHPDLPFQGGALGMFGYDLSRRFEKLPKYALNDINLPDIAIGFYDWALIVDHYKKQVSLLSYSDVKKRLLWLEEQKQIKKMVVRPDFRLTSPWKTNMNFEEYSEKFNQIQNFLKNGDCYQVNLAQRFQASYEGDEWKAFIHLNKKNRAPFSAFLHLEDGHILSFSPERFIKLYAGNIQTRPIKGTLPRLLIPEQDRKQAQKLANSLKDRAENLMIVDLMRNDIGRVAIPGTIKVSELFVVEQFSSVHHLVSTILGTLLPSYHACDLLRATFPGGSITGAPKVRAMEIIDELEPHRRNAWCGSIGYISVCSSMDTSISIRTLTAFNNQIYCSAGGGIVSDSKLETEYQEIFDKVNSNILKQL